MASGTSDVAAQTAHSILRGVILTQTRENLGDRADDILKLVHEHQLMNNDDYKKLYTDVLIQEVQLKTKRILANKEIIITQTVSVTEQSELQQLFGNKYKLNFLNRDNGLHSFYAALRVILNQYCYDTIGYDAYAELHPNEIFLKDVGGNPLTMVVNGRIHNHCCCPIGPFQNVEFSNAEDLNRQSRQLTFLSTYRPKTSVEAKIMKQILNKDDRRICNKLAQQCNIKTKMLMLTHSSYNNSGPNLADMMQSAGADVAIGTFHLPHNLYSLVDGNNKYGLRWKIYRYKKIYYIKFYFKNDYQRTYVHRLDLYFTLLRSAIITSSDGRNSYTINLEKNFFDVQTFRIYRLMSPDITPSYLNTYIPHCEEDITVIHYYAINTGSYSYGEYHPIVLYVNTLTYRRLFGYLLTVIEGKFNIQNALTMLNCLCSRVSVNGIIYVFPIAMSTDDLVNIAHAVYFLVWRARFDASLVLKAVMNDEQLHRQRKSGICTFIKNIMFGTMKSTRPRAVHDLDDFIKEIKDKVIQTDETARINELKGWCVNTANLYHRQRKFFVHSYPITQTISVTQHVESLHNAVTNISMDIADPMTKYLESIVEEVQSHQLNKNFVSNELCMMPRYPTKELPLASTNNQCVFVSLANMAGVASVTTMKINLVDSIHLKQDAFTSADVIIMRKILTSDTLPANRNVFRLWALHYNKNLCVHSDLHYDHLYVANATMKNADFHDTLHLKLTDDHCTVLMPDISALLPSPPVNMELIYDQYSGNSTYDPTSLIQSGTYDQNSGTRNEFDALLKSTNDLHIAASDVRLIARFGLNLLYVDQKFDFLQEGYTFDVGAAPGSYIQVVRSKYPSNIIIAVSDTELDPSIASDISFFNLGTNGDLTNPNTVDTIHSYIRSGGIKFNTLLFDVTTSYDVIDADYAVKLVNFLSLATIGAAAGSNWLVHIDAKHHTYIKLVKLFHRSFNRVVTMKTPYQHPLDHSVVVMGFSYRNEMDVPYMLAMGSETNGDTYNGSLVNYCQMICHNIDGYVNVKNKHFVDGYSPPKYVFIDDIIKAFTIKRCTVNHVEFNNQFVVHNLAHDLARYSNEAVSPQVRNANVNDGRIHIDFDRNFLVLADTIDNLSISTTDSGIQLVTDYDQGLHRPTFNLQHDTDYHFVITTEYVLTITISGHDIIIPFTNFTTLLDALLIKFQEKNYRLRILIPSRIMLKLPHREANLFNQYLVELRSSNARFSQLKLVIDTTFIFNDTVLSSNKIDAFHEYVQYVERSHASHCVIHSENWNAYVVPFLSGQTLFGDTLIRNFNYIFSIVKKVNGRLKYLKDNPSRHQTYDYVYNIENGFIKTEELREGKVALVSEITKHYSFDRIIPNLTDIDLSRVTMVPHVELYQGVAGYGKTKQIVSEAPLVLASDRHKLTLILTQTNEGKDDIIRRLAAFHRTNVELIDRTHVRTINSFMKNPVKGVNVVYIDEAMMNHTGAIVAISILSEARLVKCYGDIVQLPFCSKLPRFSFSHNDMKSVFDIAAVYNESHRIPRSVAVVLAEEYLTAHETMGNRLPLKTWSTIVGEFEVHKINTISQIDTTLADNVFLTFTMNDKNMLREANINASTIASFQGKQHKNITVFRSSTNATDPIFNDQSMVVTVLTRCTHKLRYFTFLRTGKDRLERKMDTICTTEQLNAVAANDNIGAIKSAGTVLFDEKFFPDYSITHTNDISSLNYIQVVTTDDNLVVLKKNGRDRKTFNYVDGVRATVLYNAGVYKIMNYVKAKSMNTITFRKSDVRSKVVNISELSRHFRKSGLTIRIQVYDKHLDLKQIKRKADIVDKFMMGNAFGAASTDLPDIERVVNIDPPEATTNFLGPNVTYLQHILDLKYGPDVLFDYSYDNYMLQNFDVEYYVPSMSIDFSKDEYKPELYDALRPVLKSPTPQLRNNTQRELILATMKRNFKRPMLQDYVSEEETSDEMIKNLDCLFDRRFKSIVDTMPLIDINRAQLRDWMLGQSESVCASLEADVDIFFSDITRLKTMIKRMPKVDVMGYDSGTIQALQTINCQSKQLNAFFCVLMRQLKDRLMKLLKPNVLIYSDCSPSEFADKISTVFQPNSRKPIFLFSGDDSWISINGQSIEIDISKFDQSQTRYVLLFECKFFELMGIPEEYCRLWYLSHIDRNVSSTELGVKYQMGPQRNSGDAWTFGGNTFFLMSVVSCCIDMNYTGGLKYTPTFDKFRSMFNLEVKSNRYTVPYFCSKFLIPFNEIDFKFIPCPLKLLVKLGRRDIKNYQHLEEIRQSLIDLTSDYDQLGLCQILDYAFLERYKLNIDTATLLTTLYQVVRDEDEFRSLFYTCDGDHLDMSNTWAQDR